MAYVVYCHTNKINGKKYFGITGTSTARRWSAGAGYKTSRHFNFAIQKYGWDGFDHEIICEGLTKEAAAKMEQELISKFQTYKEEFGYNMSLGGESGAFGTKQSEETIEKRMKWIRGRKHSEETKRKISETAKGRTFSEETKAKMRAAKVGIPLTDEHKAALSASLKGKRVSDEAKAKMREARRKDMKPVYCKETDTIYESAHEAARQLDLYCTNVAAVCRGKHTHTKGYHFKYVEKNDSTGGEYRSLLG